MANPRVKVDTTVLDRILRNIPGNTSKAVRSVAFEVEGHAKEQIKDLDAIDTGAMLNSVYTRTTKSAYSETRATSEAAIAARVKRLRPEAVITPLPIPRGEHEAFVGPSVEYAIAVHYGDARRSGRPYLQNAVDDVGRDMERHFRDVVTDGKR
jgi:hypothetical protein